MDPTATLGTPAAEPGRWRAILNAMRMFWHAMRMQSLAHFPREKTESGEWSVIPSDALIRRVEGKLGQLRADGETLDAAVWRGRETLDEVKQLTEYQDEKATRLLTIITFLSAMSGVLFSSFLESYPLHANWARGCPRLPPKGRRSPRSFRGLRPRRCSYPLVFRRDEQQQLENRRLVGAVSRHARKN
jgi:hypothetical protein